MAKYKIYSLPLKVKGPQYLDLLYGNTEGLDNKGNIFEIYDFSWRKMLFGGLDKSARNVVHIHWEVNIYGSKYLLVSIARMVIRFPSLLLMKLRGIKILWTKHNMSAHDYKYPFIDKLGTEMMWRIADTVVLHERVFVESEAKERSYAKIVCVPPGNYIGSYGSVWKGDRGVVRERFGIGRDEMVILALGSVRPYKALPKVIAAHKRARDAGANLKLVIAGGATPEYARVISEAAGEDSSIKLLFGYIPDEKMAEYLALADYTICYYTDSALGSAAIMLSLSYGVPVITRDFAASELVVPGIGGMVFHSDEDLHKILTGLNKVKVAERDEIIDTVRAQDWPTAGRLLRESYIGLWNS